MNVPERILKLREQMTTMEWMLISFQQRIFIRVSMWENILNAASLSLDLPDRQEPR